MIRLRVEGVEFSYGSTKALKNVGFEVKRGKLVSILGTNGAGKSTLLKTINLILKPHKGVIYLDGKSIREMKQKELAKKISYVPQFHQRNVLRVFETVLLGRKPYIKWNITKEDVEKVENILELMNLKHLALRRMDELSGGEFQKVMLARAIAQEPDVLLLDEPTSNLDLKNQLEVMELIRKITKEKLLSTIVVMHDINLALRFSDDFILMKEGKILEAGDKGIITEENIRKTYGIEVKVIEISDHRIVIPFRSNGHESNFNTSRNPI